MVFPLLEFLSVKEVRGCPRGGRAGPAAGGAERWQAVPPAAAASPSPGPGRAAAAAVAVPLLGRCAACARPAAGRGARFLREELGAAAPRGERVRKRRAGFLREGERGRGPRGGLGQPLRRSAAPRAARLRGGGELLFPLPGIWRGFFLFLSPFFGREKSNGSSLAAAVGFLPAFPQREPALVRPCAASAAAAPTRVAPQPWSCRLACGVPAV